MLQSLKSIAAAVALIGATGSALAADVQIGATDSYDFGLLTHSKGVSVGDSIFGLSGAFNNTFSFTAAAGSTAFSLFGGLDLAGDMTMSSRFGSGAANSIAWSAWTPTAAVQSDDSGAFAQQNTLSNLVTGQTYWIQLAGEATQYNYTLTLTPVPEPETWAMLLTGVGLLGTITRRRRQASTA